MSIGVASINWKELGSIYNWSSEGKLSDYITRVLARVVSFLLIASSRPSAPHALTKSMRTGQSISPLSNPPQNTPSHLTYPELTLQDSNSFPSHRQVTQEPRWLSLQIAKNIFVTRYLHSSYPVLDLITFDLPCTWTPHICFTLNLLRAQTSYPTLVLNLVEKKSTKSRPYRSLTLHFDYGKLSFSAACPRPE